MKKIPVLLILPLFIACNNQANTTEVKHEDSLNQASDKKVDNLLKNDDSIIKAKEEELLKKYN